jgi:alpha-amylase
MTRFLLSFLTLLAFSWQARAVQVTFRVDMSRGAVAPQGVFIAGDFQSEAGFGADWNPTTTQLTDANADQVYEVTVGIPAGFYQYKFLNGSTWESALTNCGAASDYNRFVSIGSTDTTLAVAVFNTCPTFAVPTYQTHWWNDAVFYEAFVRSFYDTNGDGKGDFQGLTAKLDYLNDGDPSTTTDLGVKAIWLMPTMPSPSYHGYDITDYKGVESDYGTMADFDAFLAAAHQRGIKVILDLVLNHSSNQHPWFTQSAASDTSRYRNWYVWSPTNPGYTRPSDGARLWNGRNGSFYYAWFGSTLPDLNWRSPELKAEMWDAVRFWLNKGVDGYRLDAVTLLVEDNVLSPTGAVLDNTPSTRSLLQEFHTEVYTTKPDAFTIGETYLSPDKIRDYTIDNRLNAGFDFNLQNALVSAVQTANPAGLRGQLNLTDQTYPKLQYGTLLSNHDHNRIFSTLNSDVALMKQAAALYLTLPGVPFVYYGEEIGMLGTGADEDKRKPMQWSAALRAGFTTGNPWRTINTNYRTFNVATEQADPASILNHYKKLISLRNSLAPLRKGYYLPATSTGNVFSYARVLGDSAIVVASNFGTAAVNARLSLAASGLPAGLYYAADLYSGQTAGTVTIDSLGGFRNWTTGLSLGAKETWILRLSQTPLSVAAASAPPRFAPIVVPNPASTQVRIDLTNSAPADGLVTVYDLYGRLLESVALTVNSVTLSTESWSNGNYLLRIQSGESVSVRRLTVVH